MDLRLQGKVAIVTGSSDGIGYATAMPWREKGCVLSYTFL
jgi:NAD(P)-dependent dehydrogenase (short-subunit alcohol dehydrogenase family)